jgi:hypothetical protein
MNLINDNLDLKKMYKYQIDEIDSDKKYNEYLNYLSIFYKKDAKKEKYNKEYLDGKYILIDKSNPKKTITITPSEFIDIKELYIGLKDSSELILSKISNLIEKKENINESDRKEFDLLKKKYVSFRDKLKDIDEIHKNFNTEIKILFEKKIELSNNMARYYQKRNYEYSNIETMIKEDVKNILIKKFKDNNKKIPSDKELNKIAKDNSLSSNETEKWFKWIEVSYLYMLVKNEIKKINYEINDKETKFDGFSKYIIIRKPVIEE